MSKPFAGIRVLDFTRYLAGPYGTYQLALLGADVVKIESREGDETRISPADRTWAERKMAPSFLSMNGNKRSITLDLRRPEAIEVVKRLVVGADVLRDHGKWYRWDDVVRLAPVLPLGRVGVAADGAPEAILPGISSTDIRNWLAQREDPGKMSEARRRLAEVVPERVLAYVDEQALYR